MIAPLCFATASKELRNSDHTWQPLNPAPCIAQPPTSPFYLGGWRTCPEIAMAGMNYQTGGASPDLPPYEDGESLSFLARLSGSKMPPCSASTSIPTWRCKGNLVKFCPNTHPVAATFEPPARPYGLILACFGDFDILRV